MQFFVFFSFWFDFRWECPIISRGLSVILIAVAPVPGRDSNRGLTVLYIYIYITEGFVIGCHSFVCFLNFIQYIKFIHY
jgi:hypothetical protein